MEFIPENYSVYEGPVFSLYFCEHESKENRQHYQNAVDWAYDKVCHFFQTRLERRLNICIYNNLAHGQEMIPVIQSASQLLIPMVTKIDSLIVFFLMEAFSGNRDITRLTRHLIHEFTHLWISITSETGRYIGKGRAFNPVIEWIDEGLSEVVSLTLTGRKERLSACLEYYRKKRNLKLSEVDRYKIYTGKVLHLLKKVDKESIEEFLRNQPAILQTADSED